MNVKLNDGETAEEVFGFDEKYAKKLIEYVVKMIDDEVDMSVAIKNIYKKAKNSKEVGYMILYYYAILFANGFSEFMDDVATSVDTGVKNETNMYF